MSRIAHSIDSTLLWAVRIAGLLLLAVVFVVALQTLPAAIVILLIVVAAVVVAVRFLKRRSRLAHGGERKRGDDRPVEQRLDHR